MGYITYKWVMPVYPCLSIWVMRVNPCCFFPPNFGLLADDGCYWLLVTGSMVCEEAIGEGSPTITKYVYTSFLPPLLERGAQP